MKSIAALQRLVSLPLFVKQSIMLAADTLLLAIALWLSFCLRLGEFFSVNSGVLWLFVAAPLIAIPIFYLFGLYKEVIRFMGMRAAFAVLKAVALYAVLWGLLVVWIGGPNVPLAVTVINGMATLLLIGGSRALGRYVFSFLPSSGDDPETAGAQTRVVIFGAGESGRQLAGGLESDKRYRLCGFVDDSRELQGRELMGVPILPQDQLESFIKKYQVRELFLAVPSISRKERNRIIERLRALPLRVRTLPDLSQLLRGEATVSDFHDLEIEDLLEREPAEPDESLLRAQVVDKVVMVTGAGGSIGSEICRQVLKRRPRVLLLFELSEFVLYSIYHELLALRKKFGIENGEGAPATRIVSLLGSVQDERRVADVIRLWKPDVVYHAAAFKHVPMIEHNLSQGIKNNVLGTFTVAKSAITQGVPSVVLISTDKAVRPTNVMGCTKRVAEMVLQALVAEKAPVFEREGEPAVRVERQTHLSMVRFGNVLGSSGSVVPLFREQIRNGGPITLTHKEIIRYFMTIPEAAQLVMQAGAMSGEDDAAEVFVLDMGEPVKILDLATRMVEFSGLRVKNDACPDGDIEIAITGLRPGEKLYEELLIGDNPKKTRYHKIMKAHEEFIPWPELQSRLRHLKVAADENDAEKIRSLLQELVEGFKPDNKIVDWIHCEQSGVSSTRQTPPC